MATGLITAKNLLITAKTFKNKNGGLNTAKTFKNRMSRMNHCQDSITIIIMLIKAPNIVYYKNFTRNFSEKYSILKFKFAWKIIVVIIRSYRISDPAAHLHRVFWQNQLKLRLHILPLEIFKKLYNNYNYYILTTCPIQKESVHARTCPCDTIESGYKYTQNFDKVWLSIWLFWQ